jgi:hypothetical protein
MSIIDGFNANDVPETAPISSGPIPEGDYEVEIDDTEEKSNKAGTGRYLQVTFKIASGDHQGRKLWARLNLDNPSEKAVEIARRDLAAICRAVGLVQPKTITQFIGRKLIVTVAHKGNDPTYGPSAEIVRYHAAGEAPKKAAAKAAPKASLLDMDSDDLPF